MENIFLKYDTNKKTDYAGVYEEAFAPIRNDVKLVFEIGIHFGGSLRGFRDYFPNALIVGLDINSNFMFKEDRIETVCCDATKKESIDLLIQKYGQPDVVIDDGSHKSMDIRATHNLLFNQTKMCYVIEDYGTQRMEYDNGGWVPDGKPALDIMFGLIYNLMAGRNLWSVKVYHSVCMFFKLKA